MKDYEDVLKPIELSYDNPTIELEQDIIITSTFSNGNIRLTVGDTNNEMILSVIGCGIMCNFDPLLLVNSNKLTMQSNDKDAAIAIAYSKEINATNNN